MKRLGLAAAALLLAGTLACTEQPLDPSSTALDGRTALLERVLDLTEGVENRQDPTASLRIEAERLISDIEEWNQAHPLEAIEVEQGPAISSDRLVAAAVPIFPKPGCKPCPFIIVQGNRIGILRSEGPCRPGAGLERCFYTWIYVGAF